MFFIIQCNDSEKDMVKRVSWYLGLFSASLFPLVYLLLLLTIAQDLMESGGSENWIDK